MQKKISTLHQCTKHDLIEFIKEKKKFRQYLDGLGIIRSKKRMRMIDDIEECQILAQTQKQNKKLENIISEIKEELISFGYQRIKYLISGSQGHVFLAINKQQGCRYAIKAIQNEDQECQHEQKVIEKFIGVPNVIQFIQDHKGMNFTYLVLQECQVVLEDLLRDQPNKHFNEITAIKYSRDIAQGLFNVHQKNYLVHDIKPDNILIDYNDNALICDFGLSFELSMKGFSKSSYGQFNDGNYYYIAPECIASYNNGVPIASRKSEAYSLGLIMYRMVSSEQALHEQLINKSLGKNANPIDSSKIQRNIKCREEFIMLMKGLCEFNPEKRISIEVALKTLNRICSEEIKSFNRCLSGDYQNLMQIYNKQLEIVIVSKIGFQFLPVIEDEEIFLYENEQFDTEKQDSFEEYYEEVASEIEEQSFEQYDISFFEEVEEEREKIVQPKDTKVQQKNNVQKIDIQDQSNGFQIQSKEIQANPKYIQDDLKYIQDEIKEQQLKLDFLIKKEKEQLKNISQNINLSKTQNNFQKTQHNPIKSDLNPQYSLLNLSKSQFNLSKELKAEFLEEVNYFLKINRIKVQFSNFDKQFFCLWYNSGNMFWKKAEYRGTLGKTWINDKWTSEYSGEYYQIRENIDTKFYTFFPSKAENHIQKHLIEDSCCICDDTQFQAIKLITYQMYQISNPDQTSLDDNDEKINFRRKYLR